MQRCQALIRMRAIISLTGGKECIHATQSDVLNWTRLRQLLIDARAPNCPDVKEFAARIGARPSTIYRVEGLRKYPDHRPTLQTIVDWLAHTTEQPLSAFFLQVEQGDSGLHTVEPSGDNPPPDLSQGGDSGALDFESEERIAQRAFSLVSRALAESLERDARTRPTHYRLPASPRPLAAERRPRARKSRDGHVPSKKKKRPTKDK